MNNVATPVLATFTTVGQGWTAVRSMETQAAALKLARGCYQRNLLEGHEAWSGSTLKGRAGEYGGRYYTSRNALAARLRAAGIPVAFERRGQRNVALIG